MMESSFFDLESAKAHAQARARWVARERAALSSLSTRLDDSLFGAVLGVLCLAVLLIAALCIPEVPPWR